MGGVWAGKDISDSRQVSVVVDEQILYGMVVTVSVLWFSWQPSASCQCDGGGQSSHLYFAACFSFFYIVFVSWASFGIALRSGRASMLFGRGVCLSLAGGRGCRRSLGRGAVIFFFISAIFIRVLERAWCDLYRAAAVEE